MLTVRDLLKLAVPSVAFAVLTNAYRAVDQFWIKGVSVAAQGAVGTSIFVTIFIFGGFALVSAGAGPLMARRTGARDHEGRRAVLGSAVVGMAVIAAVVTVTGGFFADRIARAFGLEGEIAREFERYVSTLCLTVLPLAYTPLVDTAFISMGSARVPMVLQIVSLILNAVLTPLLIYDAGLGTAGAALASNVSRLVTTGLGMAILVRRVGLRWSDLRVGEPLTRILRIGAPTAVRVAIYAGVYVLIVNTLIARFHDPAVNAALGIGFSALEGFTWPCYYGVSLAVSSFVGRGLGAGTPQVAWSSIHRSLPIISGLGVGASLLFWFAGPFLTGLFTDDAHVHALAMEYVFVLGFSQLFVAYEGLASGVLEGAGDTRTPFFVQVPFNLLRVPLGYWLAFPLGMGPAGVWWAINFTTFAKAGLTAEAVRRGHWARLEI